MNDLAKIQLPEFEHDSTIINGSENEQAFDITKLRSATGHITLDPGYGNTGACISDITFIDGEKEFSDIEDIPLNNLLKNVDLQKSVICYFMVNYQMQKSNKNSV